MVSFDRTSVEEKNMKEKPQPPHKTKRDEKKNVKERARQESERDLTSEKTANFPQRRKFLFPLDFFGLQKNKRVS